MRVQVINPIKYGIVFLFTVAFALYFVPEKYALPESVYRAWQIIEILIGSYSTILFLFKCRVDINWILLSGFFFLVYFVSSVLTGADGWITSIVFSTLLGIGFVSFACYGLERYPKECLYGFCIGGTVMCLWNYVTFIFFSNIRGGIRNEIINNDQHYFLLGYDNITIFYYLPLATCLVIVAFLFRGKKMRTFSIVFCCAMTIMYLYLNSITAMLVSLLFTFFILLFYAKDSYSKHDSSNAIFPTYKFILLCGLILFVACFILVVTGSMQDMASLFGKRGSISDREIIWGKALHFFLDHPLFGVGVNAPETDVRNLTYDHTHSMIVQIIYQGGLLSLICLLLWLFQYKENKSFGFAIWKKAPLCICTFVLYFGLWLVAGNFDYNIRILPQYFPILIGILYSQGKIDLSILLKPNKRKKRQLLGKS